MSDNRSVTIGQDAIGNTIITGDGNQIVIIQTSRTLDITRVGDDGTPIPSRVINPYRGLASFSERDSEFFWGREKLVGELWQEFNSLHSNDSADSVAKILALHGPSGCGKSSVVRAGLIPRLATQPVPNREDARVLILTPGAQPLESLALALARAIQPDVEPASVASAFEDKMQSPNEDGSYDGLTRIASEHGKPLIIFVDQFEELFSFAERIASKELNRQIFISNLLLAASVRSARVSIIIAFRADFITKIQSSPELYEQISTNLHFVPPMNREELKRAISKPAEIAGHPLEEGVVHQLVNDTIGEDGALPLLQFTLTQIWDGILKGLPPTETLENLGGVGGSLAHKAKSLFAGLLAEEKVIAKRVFLRMVRVGPDIPNTSRRIAIEEVVSHSESLDRVKVVIEKFAASQARIITVAGELNGTETIRVAHEALLTNWSDLQSWLENPETRRNLILYYKVEESARYWEDKGRPSDLLWPNGDLRQLEEYSRVNRGDLSRVQLDFCEVSLKRKTRSYLWPLVGVLSVGIASFVIYDWSPDSSGGSTNANNGNQVIAIESNTPSASNDADETEDGADGNSGSPEPVKAESVAGKRWRNGQTVRIRFMGGTPAEREKVKTVASEWTAHANLKFVFDSSPNAEIRISFVEGPNWSMIGTDALNADKKEATMNFGYLSAQGLESEETRRGILHEFGHALGLYHEHQSPSANIPWNKKAVYDYLAAQGYQRTQVDRTVFAKIETEYRPFDRDSIMMYFPIPQEFLLGTTFEPIPKLKTNLSDSDKELVRKLYPPM